MYIYIGRYSTCNDSARYIWAVVYNEGHYLYLPWPFFLDWQTKTYLRYDTISSVLVEYCQKNPGITLRDVRG